MATKKKYNMSGESVRASDTKRFIKASYDKVKDAEKNINGYILDTSLSSAEAKVYHNPTTNQTIVANRGTKGLSDWGNNARYGADLATGGYFNLYTKSDRFQNAKDIQKKAIEKYGKVDTNIGHSQSGIITRKLNKKGLTGEVINANPATFFDKSKANETNIRSTFDPVSMFNRDATTIKYNTINPLKAHSTDFIGTLGDKSIGVGIKQKIFKHKQLDNSNMTGSGHEHETHLVDRMKGLVHDIRAHRKAYGRKDKIIDAYKMLGHGIKCAYESSSDGETDDESSSDDEMEGGKISRSKKFNKWMKNLGGVTKSVGDYIAPVAKPIFQAGTKAAVSKIAGYGIDGGKISRSKKFNKWMKNLGGVTKSIGDYIAPVAKPIFQAGTNMAVKKIAGYGLEDMPKRRGRPPKGTITTMPVLTGRKPRMSPPDYSGSGFMENLHDVSNAGSKRLVKLIDGSGVGRGRPAKGSEAAKAWGAKMKAARDAKRH